MMYLELKQVIIDWMIENKNLFNLCNACHDQFRQYIYDDNGNYIIGGKIVSNFIRNAQKLLFNQDIEVVTK